jgi:hypothetical protein
MAVLANVLPSTNVANRSWGSSNSRNTIPPTPVSRAANCRACHLVSESRAVSARAKKKLAPANSITITAAAIGPGAIASA